MKYVVTKDGRHCRMYAIVARDGSVLWNPQPVKATELSKERAIEVATQLGACYKPVFAE